MDQLIAENDSFHKVFKNNPLEMRKMVNNVVKVHYNSNCIEGTVYTIDPVSQMIALLVKNENNGTVDMHVILEKHIESIEVIGVSDFTVKHDLFDKTLTNLTPAEKDSRCDKLLNWLLANMIPVVKEGDVLKLTDVLTINPPYELDCCVSKNVIILEKIQNLMKAMNKSV